MNEEGFSYINLAKHSRSGRSRTFKQGNVNVKPFHLVIPKNVLKEGTKYKFRLVAVNEERVKSSITTVLKTVVLPKLPTCAVEPSDGSAVGLNTTVTVTCENSDGGGISDDDNVFIFRYQTLVGNRARKPVYLTDVYGSEDLAAEFTLPSGRMNLLLEVCDGYGTCSQGIIGNAVYVVKENPDINVDTVKSEGVVASDLAKAKEPLAAIGKLRQVR